MLRFSTARLTFFIFQFTRRGSANQSAIVFIISLFLGIFGRSLGQTNPTAQSLPYSEDFSSLMWTSTAYPAGLQGWTISTTPGSSFNTTGPTADRSLIASRDASDNTGDVDNYNGTIGFLNNSSLDLGIVLAINTTSLTSISVSYDIMTIRNPYDGSSNTRINEVTLQYRVGTTGSWNSLTGIEYQNNTTQQTNGTTPQNSQSKSITLPVACSNQSVVQLRWASRQVSGAGSRPSFAIDNISVGGTSITTFTSIANGDWNTASTWDLGSVPTADAFVVINHNVSVTSSLINTGSITVNSSGTLALSSAFTDNGVTTVNGVLQINSGGSVSGSSPTYGTGATLQYNSGGTFNRSIEWNAISGAGYPYNVQISNNTTFDLGANGGTNIPRQIASNLTIDNGSTFSMNVSLMTQPLSVLGTITITGSIVLSGSSGGDLNIAGNWIMGASGTLTANNRAVTFNGSTGTQLLTGNTTFYDLTLNNSGATTDFGSTTITITHDLKKTAGSMNGNTSTIIFTGNPGDILGNGTKFFYNLQINSGANISNSGNGSIHISNDFRNDGTFTQASSLTTYFDKANSTETMSGTPAATSFGNLVIGSSSFGALATALNAGSHNFTLTGGSLTFNASSIFNGNTSTVNFTTTNSTVSGTGTANFYNVTITSFGIDFGTISTILNGGSFTINSGGYVDNNHPPTYANGSTLIYNVSYNRYNEWQAGSSGVGVPYHVQVNSGYTVTLDANGSGARTANGNLTLNGTLTMGAMTNILTVNGSMNIGAAGALTLSTGSGGDIKVGGDWTQTIGGTFTPNSRAVYFTGTALQTITRSASGTLNFDYVINSNSSASGVKLSSGTSIYISTLNGGNGLQLLNIGPLDLNGNTCTLGSNNYGTIQITGGARSVISSSGTGVFILNGGPVPTPPKVYNSDLASSLTFSSSVRVELNNGFDFSSNTTAINGILRINSSGFAYNNAPTYGTGSLLQYYTNGVYNRTIEWGTTSGPGYPYNVELSNNTTLDPGGSSSTGVVFNLAHDLTIDAGSSLYMDYASDDMTVPLTIGNDLLLNGNLSLSNVIGGDVKIFGNWTRGASGNFYPNLRAAFFNGSASETITVIGGGNEAYDYLIIDNSSGVMLSSSPATNVYVNYSLTFINGNITTNSNEVYIKSTSSTSVAGHKTDPTVAGYTSSSRIIGNMRRNVVLNTDYDFPVGTASNYEYAKMKFTNVASITNVLANFTAGTSGTFTGCTINGTSIVGMLNGGYWTMTPTGATTGAIYDLTLFETGYTNVIASPNYIGLIKRNTVANPWSGTDFGSDGTHINSTQALYSGPVAKAVRTNIPSFSDYAIGFSNDIVLPIELTEFTVAASGNDAVLTWNTSSEYNSDFFAVERSLDEVAFEQIGIVNAAGASILPSDYSFIDYGVNEFPVNKIYYRLRMVDADESFEYSAVRWINVSGNSGSNFTIVYPNPFSDNVSLSWNSTSRGTATVQVVDVSGRIVLQQNVDFVTGNNFVLLDQFASLSQGVYFLRLSAGKTQLTQKLVKE